MLLPLAGWKKTRGKRAGRKANKVRWQRPERRVSLEPLEQRLLFSGASVGALHDPNPDPPCTDPCGCPSVGPPPPPPPPPPPGPSGAGGSGGGGGGGGGSGDGGDGVGDPSYNGNYNPHPVIRFDTWGPDVGILPQPEDAAWMEAVVRVSLPDESSQFGPPLFESEEIYYEVPESDDPHAFAFQFDATDLPTGRYSWEVEFQFYDEWGEEIEVSYKTYFGHIDVINRKYSDPVPGEETSSFHYNEFGVGWHLPELDRLYVLDVEEEGPNAVGFHLEHEDGVQLVTGANQTSWFAETATTYNDGEYAAGDSYVNRGTLVRNGDGTYTLENIDGTLAHFNSAGLLTSRVDRNGNARTYVYGDGGGDAAEDELLEIIDAAGRVTHFDYDGNGMMIAVTDFYDPEDPSPHTTTYSYDGTGHLIKVTQPDPDDNGPQSSPFITYVYGTSGNEEGLLTSIIDARGLETTISYDQTRRISQVEQRCGGTIDITTQASQLVVDISQTGYDEYNLAPLTLAADIYEHRDVYGKEQHIKRDRFGNITELVDDLGNVTTYTYNDFGQLTNVTYADPDAQGLQAAQFVTYRYAGPDGLLDLRFDNVTSESWGFTDTQKNQPTSYTDRNGVFYEYELDDNGNVLTVTPGSDEDLATTYTYTDAQDDTLLGLVETMTDANGNITHYQYNARGLATSVTYGDGSADEYTVEYTYDARDRLATMTDGLGRVTTYVWDFLDRLAQRIDPDPDGSGPLTSPIWTYWYDGNGNRTHVIDPLGSVTEYIYDVRDRLVQVIQPLPAGLPSTTILDNGSATLTGSWTQNNRSLAYGGTVHTSDGNGQDATFSFTGLDSDKKYLVQVRWQPISTVTYDKNAEWQVFGDTSSDPLTTLRVDLNRKEQGLPDNQLRMWQSLGAFDPYSDTLTVKLVDTDNNGRLLIDAVRLVEVGPVTKQDFDCYGNLTSTTDPLGNETMYTYDELNRLIQRTDPDPDGAGGQDAPVTNYRYDNASRLVSMTDAEGNVTLYEYDTIGRRIATHQTASEGLLGEYYYSPAQQQYPPEELVYSRVDAQIDFEPVSDGFDDFSDLDDGHIHIVWTGAIYISDEIAEAGPLSFHLETDDKASVSIDGQEFYYVDHQYENEVSTPNTLLAGWHFIEVQYWEIDNSDGENGLTMSYTPYGGSQEVVSSDILRTLQTTTTEYATGGGLVQRVTDAENRRVEYDYDDVGRLTRAEQLYFNGSYYAAAGPATEYQYDNVGNVVREIQDRVSEADLVTVHAYDALNRRVKTWDPNNSADVSPADGTPDGAFTQYTYDAAGNLLSLTDPAGNTTAWVYDGLDRMIQETNELDQSRHFQYDALGNLTEKIDRRGLVTQWTYDRLSRQTSELWFEAQAETPIKGRFVFYNHSAFDNDDTAANAYDDDAIAPNKTPLLPGQASSAANHLGYTKGINGLMVDIDDLPGAGNDYEDLDAGDFIFRVGTSGDPDGWSAGPAPASITVRPGDGVDGSDRITIIWDDGDILFGWLQVTVKATADTGLSADDVFYLANMAGDFDGDLGATLTDYNLWRTTGTATITDGADGDKNGGADLGDYNTWRTAPGTGFAPLTAPGVESTPLRTISYAYDYAGRLVSVTDRDDENDPVSADYTYSYDELGRITAIEMALAGLAAPVTLAATYDLVGRRTSLGAEIDGTDDFVNEYTWDSLSRLSQVVQHGVVGGHSVADKRVDFGYNLANQFASITRYADLAGSELVATSAYGYDNAGRLNALTHAQDTTTFAGYEWLWDDVNRNTSFTNSQHSGEDATYDYDLASQLTGADRSGTSNDEGYSYDANGNRETANGDTYVTGDNNQLTDDDTYTYEYDEEGSLTKRITLVDEQPTGATTEFEYDHRNRLVKVTDKTSPTGTITKVTEYGYDGFDRAVKKTVDPDGAGNEEPVTEFSIYDGSRAVLKLDESGEVIERLLWEPAADMLLADETAADGVFWMLGDHQGTIRDVLDADGDVVNHIALDSFGNIQSQTENAPTTTIVYASLVWDNDIGQYRSFTRMYLATIGQWTGEDWIGFNGGDPNLRRYVSNSVTNAVDPTGLIPGGRRPPSTPLPPGWGWWYNPNTGHWVKVPPTGWGVFKPVPQPSPWEMWKGEFDNSLIAQCSLGIGLGAGALAGGVWLIGFNPWLGAIGIHGAHHGLGTHGELILRIGHDKVLKIIVPGKDGWIWIGF